MNYKSTYRSFLVLVLSLSLGRMALASTTWYVDGVHGSNGNNCKAPASACKTIGHAIALASSGDFIRVAGATYTENLDIGISLKLIGSGATTTIIDGGSNGRVVTVSNAGADVTLSNVTIQNGSAHVSCFFIFNCFGNPSGGGVFNMGTLTINSAIISSNTANGGCWWRYGRLLCFYASGGGIFNMGTLTINSAIISSNTASAYCASSFGPLGCRAAGGGITNSGTLTISNSTISGNSVRHGVNGLVALPAVALTTTAL